MDNIFPYSVKLPDGINEMIVPCCDGYTVYIDNRLSDDDMKEAYEHAVRHILGNDWEKDDIQQIEEENHVSNM